jgi:hypothetical protein
MNWHVGQQVYCLRYGVGRIIHIDDTKLYPIRVQFPDETRTYTLGGKLYKSDLNPMLYHAKPEFTVPKWQPKPGEWCWFWDTKAFAPCLGQFEQMNGRKYRDTESRNWDFCELFIGELPSYLKEVKP